MVDAVRSEVRVDVLDVDTFTDLYCTHIDAIFNYCLFRTGNRVVAEDLTSDTFERAWRARRRYRPERAAFSTWLHTIARRVTTDWQRRQRRRQVADLTERYPDGAPLPESQIEESESQQRLRQLVAGLNNQEQELIALKFGAGMTNRKIGQLLGKKESAVGSAIYRAMQKLRTVWSEDGPG